MRKSLIAFVLAALAIFGGSANAADTVAAGKVSATGQPVQVSEEPGAETWSIQMTASFEGLVEGSQASVSLPCTLTANGIAASNPIPDDNPFWTISCSNEDASSTLLLELAGGNRPLKRGPADAGMSIIEIGGPATINGDYHQHVATCRGPVDVPSIELACVIL